MAAKLNQNGQAIIEFVLFLPFVLVMYSLTMAIGNAINGSINQQKVTRGYLYARVLHNSTIPKPEPRDQAYQNWSLFGMYFIGYNERREGNTPVAACYKMQSPLPSDEDQCDKYRSTSTNWIRVQTVYGICGATYIKDSSGLVGWAQALDPAATSTLESCLIR
jgi:hypothetical protein